MAARIVASLAALALAGAAFAQVGTTVKEGAKATSQKAQEVGDNVKGSFQSGPRKAATQAKAEVHHAKAHVHAKTAKDAGKEIPK